MAAESYRDRVPYHKRGDKIIAVAEEGGRREETGVRGLDKRMQGGVPSGHSVLVSGSVGAGKTTFARQFAYQGLIKGEQVLYVTTTELPDRVVEQMTARGMDVSKYSDSLTFIDAYSWRTGAKKGNRVLSSITRLNELLILVQEALEDAPGPGRLVIDSVSDLLLHNEESSVFKFLQLALGKASEKRYTSLVVVEAGIHSQQVLNTLEYLTDGTIEMKIEGEKRFLRIKRMMDTVHPLTWVEYTIKQKMTLGVEEFFE